MLLKRIRIYADLKQHEVASILGVSRSSYSTWEQERDIIPLNHLNNFCNHFNVSIDYVLGLSNIKKYPNGKDEIDYKLLAKRLKLIRRLNDVTQDELAQKLNIARSSISKYENNINIAITSYLIGFSKYFNISCDFLTGKIDEELKIKEYTKN